MHGSNISMPTDGNDTSRAAKLREQLRAFFAARRQLRKGVCMLNAGLFSQAIAELEQAAERNESGNALPAPLRTALTGQRKSDQSTAHIAADTATAGNIDRVTRAICHALACWRNNQADTAVQILRDAMAEDGESAELHYQLGTMLATMGQTEEAELRFTQAVAINGEHADALVALAMCSGAQMSPRRAARHLQRAQQLKPADARLTLMLAMAGRAAAQSGSPVAVRAEMPDEASPADESAVAELSLLIEREPDFAEALLSLSTDEVDQDAYQLLVRTLLHAIERNPRQALIRYHCGRVLERMGRVTEAISQAERAVDIDPKCVQALILLAQLYARTDRQADAVSRLEQTIAMGADYADAYYLLGNLYRDGGYIGRARWAYQHALRINGGYRAAKQALEALAA